MTGLEIPKGNDDNSKQKPSFNSLESIFDMEKTRMILTAR